MPIYEYECQECQKVTEAWQNVSEKPLTTCTSCQGELKKIISCSSFQLKGGGWYADGYSNANPPSTCEAKPAAASTSPCQKAATCPCAS